MGLLWEMLRAILIGLVLGSILAPRETHAADWGTERWSAGDTIRQGTLVGLQIIDWRQTLWFTKHPTRSTECAGTQCNITSYHERNPILGAHPSVGQINNIVGASIIGHALISAALPRSWREPWQYVWIGAETYSTAGNYRMLGVKAIF